MHYMVNHPRLLCFACLVAMWLAARLGAVLRRRFRVGEQEGAENLALVVPASLTLLGLIIGFTFSMATNRYDQRRHYEEDEANAIGTEYLRAGLLPAANAAAARGLLVQYLDRRVAFYESDYGSGLQAYTQFAWWNRIPDTAWGLLIVVSLFSNVLVGYAARRSRDGRVILWVLPVLIATAFFLISDIDSPRGGIIRVHPMDLMALQHQLEPGAR
jgi:hypothetical protein